MPSRAVLFTPPTHRAFPQECSRCGCCGHNAMSHDRFMAEFPEIASDPAPMWISGQIHHACVWCRRYPHHMRGYEARLRERKQRARKSSTEGV